MNTSGASIFYYLNDDRQPVGPMDLKAIRKLSDAGIVDSEVLVCPAGEEEWKSLTHWKEPVTERSNPPLAPPPPRSSVVPSLSPLAAAISPPYPEWLPFVSTIAGVFSLLMFYLPVIAFLLGAAALTSGILILRQAKPEGRRLAWAGAITGALGLLALLFGVFGGGGEVAAIEDALAEGIQISQIAARQFPDSAAHQAKFVAYELQKVDTRGGPPEFRVAYQRNVDAWEAAIPYFEVNNPAVWFLEGFFGGLSNDYSAVGFTDYQARVAAQNIDETYRDLRTIAVAYGARIPTP